MVPYLGCMRKEVEQASKDHSSMGSASVSALSFCFNFPKSWTIIKVYRPNNSFPLQVTFGHGVHHNNTKDRVPHVTDCL